MNFNRSKWFGCIGLLAFLTAFGVFVIPAHVVSIWMDPEFTDWISPIANRLTGGARLYEYGMHFPMPPLSYVLLHVLHPAGAIWIQENFLNYVFESASLLLLYQAYERKVGPGLAFAACLATLPVFLAFGKTILYDSMAQFFVVVCGMLTASLVDGFDARQKPGSLSNLRWPVLIGFTLGLLMLTKQSTGVGAMAGVGLTLFFLPANTPLKYRCCNVAIAVIISVLAIVALCLLMSKFVSFSGMIHDVFLTGSEPKGGPRKILANFARYTLALSKIMAIAAAVFYIVSISLRRKIDWRTQAADLDNCLMSPVSAKAPAELAQIKVMLVAAGSGAVCVLLGWFLPMDSAAFGAVDSKIIWPVYLFTLNLGLAACIYVIVRVLIPGLSRPLDPTVRHPLAPYAILFFSTALFHNLSVHLLRWWADLNPIVSLVMIFLLGAFYFKQDRQRGWRVIGPVLFVACICLMWAGFLYQFKRIRDCTVEWPEIPHLAGAKLRKESGDLRQMVHVAQNLADKAKHDTVLLLPEDPNVEAWIDRDRPPLSCNILFTDQYWDRYVDPDFALLKSHPPKVIIIGPRNYWRNFSRVWHWYRHEGVIRLIDRIQDELLPADYDLYDKHRISFQNGEDYMDIYLRRN